MTKQQDDKMEKNNKWIIRNRCTKCIHIFPILHADQYTMACRCGLSFSIRHLCNPDWERTGRKQAEKPDQRLREVLHQHGEQRQAAKHNSQHGAHRAGKLRLLE